MPHEFDGWVFLAYTVPDATKRGHMRNAAEAMAQVGVKVAELGPFLTVAGLREHVEAYHDLVAAIQKEEDGEDIGPAPFPSSPWMPSPDVEG